MKAKSVFSKRWPLWPHLGRKPWWGYKWTLAESLKECGSGRIRIWKTLTSSLANVG